MKFMPKSLAGQIALAVGLALLLAQAINLALLVRERERRVATQISAPAVTRLADAIERDAAGQLPADRPRRRNLMVTSANPIALGMKPRPDIAERARSYLAEQGVAVRDVVAAEGRGFGRRPGRRGLIVAAQVAPGRWISTVARLPGRDPRFGALLIVQTLFLYILVLAPVLWLVRRLARPLGELTGAVESFRDSGAPSVEERGPSDVRRLIAAYNAMRARLVALLDEKDRMLGAIGHDLRTPLASLRVRAEGMEDEGEREKMAGTIEEMDQTLDDILSLARLGRPSEAVSRVDLAALADQIVDDFQTIGAPVTLEDSARLPVSIRPTLIARAIRNLVDNAVKHGGSARVSVARSEDDVTLTIDDDGPGIPADRIQAMFEPFARMEESRSRETGGAGLGLALAKAIAEQHDGRLNLANRPEGGLRAVLSLPG